MTDRSDTIAAHETESSSEAASATDQQRLRILFVLLEVSETNSPYSELALGFLDKFDVGLCTFFKPGMKIHESIRLYAGDKTFGGFFRALDAAMADADYDVVHVHTPHVGLLFLLRTALNRRIRSRMVITVHNAYENHKFRNKILLLPNMAFSKRVVCCGRAAFESFPFVYRWLAGKRFRYVPNGVNLERIDRVQLSAAPRRGGDRFRVICASRLVKIKNMPGTLQAYHAAADSTTEMAIIGEGPVRGELEQYVDEHGLREQVTFTGLIERDSVFERMLGADLFVSTSFGEGLPVAALEAMGCGCPVVLSDIPPHREIVRDMDAVPLIPATDVSGFAREIRRIKEMSPDQRADLGAACRRHVEEYFSLPAMLSGYEGVYHELNAARTAQSQPRGPG